jgi:hypothetical protein
MTCVGEQCYLVAFDYDSNCSNLKISPKKRLFHLDPFGHRSSFE